MKSEILRVAVVIAATVLMLFGTLNAALAWSISGTIYGGSSPLANATITLSDAATSTPAGSTSADAGGKYSLAVSDGSFNLTIVPPDGSGFGTSLVNGIAVSGANVTQDVVLMHNAVSLSGTMKGYGGLGLANAQARVFAKGTRSPQLATITADPQGRYSILLAPGAYDLWISSGTLDPSVAPSQSWFSDGGYFSVQLSQDTAYDLTLPLVRLSGSTTDSGGGPVPNVQIFCAWYKLDGGSNGGYVYGESQTVSDAQGRYSIIVPRLSSGNVVLIPPFASDFSATNLIVNANADTVKDLVVTKGKLLSGTVKGYGGIALAGVQARIFAKGTRAPQLAAATTDDQGYYSVRLAPGEYELWLTNGPANPSAAPNQSWLSDGGYFSAQVTQDTTYDIALPFVRLTGDTTDPDGVAVPGVQILSAWYKLDGGNAGGYVYGESHTVSDAQGHYSMIVTAATSGALALIPPAGGAYAATNITVNAAADTVQNLIVDRSRALSGTIKGYNGLPLAGTQVRVFARGTRDPQLAAMTADAQGSYRFLLAPGDYELWLNSGTSDPNAAPGQNWFSDGGYFAAQVIQDTTYDMTLPFIKLSGSTTDVIGVPAPGVQIQGSWYKFDGGSNGGYVYAENVATSDSQGRFALMSLLGADQIVINPPEGSGFSPTSLDGLNATHDALLSVILSIPDTTPPSIISGPTVRAVSDSSALVEWQTNEPATSGVVYGGSNPPDTTTTDLALTTWHTMPLTGLQPGTAYYLQIASSDASGNGPAISPVLSFATKPTPDARAPVILTGPTLSSITQSSALVEWTTDEPSTGAVLFGLANLPDRAVTVPTLATSHRVTLSELTPETLYYLKTTATDAAGNGPSATTLVTFRTVAAPDLTPPVILEGPMAINVSDTGATVIWKTDEPATSGVSWNDGTAHGVLSDEGLSTTHSMRIAGLTAATHYFFTVSSKDGFANGPTLSAVTSFTTQPAPDTKPPVFILAPAVKSVNHQMALIYWETDEPADSVIEYGTSSALGSSDAHAERLTKHNLPLTGLAAGTAYFFRVLARDASGNGPTASPVYSFTTDQLPGAKAPVISAPPAVVYASEKEATVYFETDLPCDTVVEYGAGSSLTNSTSSGDKVNKHQATITNLTPNTSYGVQVSCTDLEGQTVTAAAGRPVTRLAMNLMNFVSDALVNVTGVTGFTTGSHSDTTLPVITSAPTVTALAPNQATIIWSTDKITDSKVSYRLSSQQLTTQAGDIAQVFSHAIVLTNLTPNTLYQFTVQSVDPARNSVTSSGSFTTSLTLNGACGSANGGTSDTAPAVNLCAAGNASPVSGAGPWGWSCSGINGGTAASCLSAISQKALYLTVAGTGSGSVVSTPAGIAANISSSASFALGTPVTLHAKPDDFCLFANWLGCTVNANGDCAVTMNGIKNVTATFNKDLAHLTRIGALAPYSFYSTLQTAYAQVPAGGTVRVSDTIFSENLAADQAKRVLFKGGYSGSYTSNGSFTVLKGTLKIKKGTLAVERLLVRP